MNTWNCSYWFLYWSEFKSSYCCWWKKWCKQKM